MKLTRTELTNVLEKYTDASISPVVAEAHKIAISECERTCKNCINSNPRLIKYIGGKKHTFCDNLGFYVDIDNKIKSHSCWTHMWTGDR